MHVLPLSGDLEAGDPGLTHLCTAAAGLQQVGSKCRRQGKERGREGRSFLLIQVNQWVRFCACFLCQILLRQVDTQLMPSSPSGLSSNVSSPTSGTAVPMNCIPPVPISSLTFLHALLFPSTTTGLSASLTEMSAPGGQLSLICSLLCPSHLVDAH
ncbi:unnamed protein product [Rangifer tarandus platyrhynchus]|uniref:Uncharacterized protein n=2 Tax=Rangifer tarandus platyrhynchus TaxID=3082113 RepID=A0ABN8ZIM2_RANTA|nr:unnamed protein product [Rangifer tarandus platyrhynchus]